MNEQYKKKYLKYKNKYNKFKKKIKGGYTYPAIIGSVSLIALLVYLIKKELDKNKIIKINIDEPEESNESKEYIEPEGTTGSNNTIPKESIKLEKSVGGPEKKLEGESDKDFSKQPGKSLVKPPVKSEADLELALSLKN